MKFNLGKHHLDRKSRVSQENISFLDLHHFEQCSPHKAWRSVQILKKVELSSSLAKSSENRARNEGYQRYRWKIEFNIMMKSGIRQCNMIFNFTFELIWIFNIS